MRCQFSSDGNPVEKKNVYIYILKSNMDHGFLLPAHRMSTVEIETTQNKRDNVVVAFLSGNSHRVCLAESVYSLQVVRASLLQELYNTKEGSFVKQAVWKKKGKSLHALYRAASNAALCCTFAARVQNHASVP